MKKSIVLLFLLAVSILTLRLTCHAEGKTVSAAEYARALAVVESKLDASAASVDKDEDIAYEMPGDTAKRELRTISAVRQEDGSIQRVDTAGLTTSILAADNAKTANDQSAGYKGCSRRLALIRGEVLASAHLPGDDGSQQGGEPMKSTKSRNLARQILSGPDFASDPVPPPSWLERKTAEWGKSFDNWFNKLFNRPARNTNFAPINPNILWGILWTLVGALFILVVWLIVGLIGRRQRRVKPLSLSDSEEALVEARDKDTLMSVAERHAKAGDYRAAFRLVYLATLISLDTDGVLRFDRSKTNWEYVRQLRNAGRSDVYDVLAPLTRDFDRIWYGLSPTSPDVYRNAVLVYEKLTAPAEKASAAA